MARDAGGALTVERIDAALMRLLHFIETVPDGERLWRLVDILEAERERIATSQDRLAAARARITARSRDRMAGQP